MLQTPDKRCQIMEAAEMLFHRYGYSKTSLEDIAKEAGIGKGTIYYYFQSKEDIFFEVAQKHADCFFSIIRESIQKETNFISKFKISISLPIKLVYEHAPLLIDAVKNLPLNYLQKVQSLKEENKIRMKELLREVCQEGLSQGIITETIPVSKLVDIIFYWFLLGDSNIIIQKPEEFITKAEADYSFLVQLMLFGLVKRGE